MKWKHWLVWGLLAVWSIVLGIVVLADKPAEARDCRVVATATHLGVGVDVPCPEWPRNRSVIEVYVQTPQGWYYGVIEKQPE